MDQPRWKQAYDAVEKQAAPALQKFLANEDVIDAIVLGTAIQRRAREDAARFIRRQLHAVNLPSGTDVRAVSNQIAGLERQIRLLNKRIDELQARNDLLEQRAEGDVDD